MATTSIFGKYVLLRKLASGGMGEVFLAKKRGPAGFEKLLVIKRILSHHLDKPDYVSMFFGEAKLVARLSHHNIIQIYEMGKIHGEHYIAMEYVYGKSLRDIVDELKSAGRTLPLVHVVGLASMLCDGLGYAHHACDPHRRPLNIVHRDVNPHNVLISYNGDLKIIDFGIAKSEMTAVQTATGTIKGKFVYMSPEQSAADPLDMRSDIFSLGIVIYELACLENPFVRQNVVLSLEAIQRHDVPPPSARRPDAAPLDAIVQRALAKRPEDRFQSAYELRDALRELLRDGAIGPAQQDLPELVQSMFAAEMKRDERLLSEAEASLVEQAASPPETLEVESELIEAGGVMRSSYRDDEPTESSNDYELAARSRRIANRPGRRSVRQIVSLPPPISGPVDDEPLPSTPPPKVVPTGRAFPLLPAVRSSDERVFDVPIAFDSDASESMLPTVRPLRHDESPPIPFELEQSSHGASGGGQAWAPNGAMRHDGGGAQNSAVLSEPLPSTLKPVSASDTDESQSGLPVPWERMGWAAIHTAVLVVTVTIGYVATRAMLETPAPEVDRPLPPAATIDEIAPLPLTEITKPASEPARSPVAAAEVSTPSTVATGPRGPIRALPASSALSPATTSKAPPSTPTLTIPSPPPARTKRAAISAAKVAPRSPRSPAPTPASRAIDGIRAPARAKKVSKPLPRGRITVESNQAIRVRHGGFRRSGPAKIPVNRRRGTLVISGADLDYRITLAYRVTRRGLSFEIKCDPWAIVRHQGLSLGRTPQPLPAAARHRLQLLKPGQEAPLMLSLRWKASP